MGSSTSQVVVGFRTHYVYSQWNFRLYSRLDLTISKDETNSKSLIIHLSVQGII